MNTQKLNEAMAVLNQQARWWCQHWNNRAEVSRANRLISAVQSVQRAIDEETPPPQAAQPEATGQASPSA